MIIVVLGMLITPFSLKASELLEGAKGAVTNAVDTAHATIADAKKLPETVAGVTDEARVEIAKTYKNIETGIQKGAQEAAQEIRTSIAPALDAVAKEGQTFKNFIKTEEAKISPALHSLHTEIDSLYTKLADKIKGYAQEAENYQALNTVNERIIRLAGSANAQSKAMAEAMISEYKATLDTLPALKSKLEGLRTSIGNDEKNIDQQVKDFRQKLADEISSKNALKVKEDLEVAAKLAKEKISKVTNVVSQNVTGAKKLFQDIKPEMDKVFDNPESKEAADALFKKANDPKYKQVLDKVKTFVKEHKLIVAGAIGIPVVLLVLFGIAKATSSSSGDVTAPTATGTAAPAAGTPPAGYTLAPDGSGNYINTATGQEIDPNTLQPVEQPAAPSSSAATSAAALPPLPNINQLLGTPPASGSTQGTAAPAAPATP